MRLATERFLPSRFFFDFSGFHNQYHDLIAQGPVTFVTAPPAPFPANALLAQLQYQNGIYGNTDGGEIGSEWRPFTWWQIKAAYSYLHVHLGDQFGFKDKVTLTTLHGSSPNNQAVLPIAGRPAP